MLVNVPDSLSVYYGSLNSPVYMKTLDDFAWHIANSLPRFAVLASNTPTQFDCYSCGIFICFKMWRHDDKSVSSDLTTYRLLRRRFEMLQFVLDGKGEHFEF